MFLHISFYGEDNQQCNYQLAAQKSPHIPFYAKDGDGIKDKQQADDESCYIKTEG